MPVRHYIVPSSPINDRQIYATGADYFPTSFQNKVAVEKFSAQSWVKRVQEHSAIIQQIFNEIFEYIDFFGKCAHSIAEGRNPRLSSEYWSRVNHHMEGFQSARMIEPSSPKTYQYIKMIEEKYLTFLRNMVWSLENSTPSDFAVQGHLPTGFQLDEMIGAFQSPKLQKIPLVQSLLHTAAYLDSYLEGYRQIHEDNYLKNFPKEWKASMANISASGIAVNLGKRFPLYSHVDVYLYFPVDDRVLKFNGSIVDIRTDEKKHQERIAINFEFPDGNLQDYLQIQIQKQEVKECMDIVL
ncbi:PilZ domain-containing protein [Thiomicrorhabdus sp.]|uniref:PilZ domain-containing protein n=1 Tax=Thiomicrorhabdus sp. TaxID=2039724 RepID=UPI0035628DF4